MAAFQYSNVLLAIFNICLSLFSVDCIHFHSPLERGKLGGSSSHGQGFQASHSNGSKEDLNSSGELSPDNTLLGWFQKELDKTSSFNNEGLKNTSYETPDDADEALVSPLILNHQGDMNSTTLASVPVTTTKKPSKKSKQNARHRNRQRGTLQQTSEKPTDSLSTPTKEFIQASNTTAKVDTEQPSALSPSLLRANSNKTSTTGSTLDGRHYDLDEHPQSSSHLKNSSVADDYLSAMNKSSSNPQINARSQQVHLTFAWVIVPVSAVAACVVIGVCYRRKEKQRQFEYMSQQLLPNYLYNPADDQDDWENRLISENMGLKSRPQVSSLGCEQESNVVEV